MLALGRNAISPISDTKKDFSQIQICCILMQLWTKAGKVIKLALGALHTKNTKLTKSVKIRGNPWLNIIKFSVFSVHSVATIQSKTLTLKNKNLNFQNFLSPFPTTVYGPRVTRNE